MVYKRTVQLSFVLYAADDSELFATCRMQSQLQNFFTSSAFQTTKVRKIRYSTTETILGSGDGGSSKRISQEENVWESKRVKEVSNKRSA